MLEIIYQTNDDDGKANIRNAKMLFNGYSHLFEGVKIN